ncbi:hypothetical protein BDV95DRAFT_19897 [Massariosphaeria phaeospora]|uniref:Uncharacterized protein n=1 Tax=Massariosphaeria phaeospora TaxID=100035 RepID=A0A7C8MHD9_9PLEO|nr:hypothetical protein BDV95DRAFT_19897 [Massariosphaeria phaeospora]
MTISTAYIAFAGFITVLAIFLTILATRRGPRVSVFTKHKCYCSILTPRQRPQALRVPAATTNTVQPPTEQGDNAADNEADIEPDNGAHDQEQEATEDNTDSAEPSKTPIKPIVEKLAEMVPLPTDNSAETSSTSSNSSEDKDAIKSDEVKEITAAEFDEALKTTVVAMKAELDSDEELSPASAIMREAMRLFETTRTDAQAPAASTASEEYGDALETTVVTLEAKSGSNRPSPATVNLSEGMQLFKNTTQDEGPDETAGSEETAGSQDAEHADAKEKEL